MFVSKIRVTVAHPTPLLCAGLEAAIRTQADFDIVTAPLAQSHLDPGSMVVTDYETGLELAFSRNTAGHRILIITHDQSEANIRRAMEAGIRGYLLVTAPLDTVVRAIRSIHRGGSAFDPVVSAKMVASLAAHPLTSREVDVLRLLMLGLGDKQIAMKLMLSLSTVKTHLKAIRVKLRASTRTEAVAIAQRRGLIPGIC